VTPNPYATVAHNIGWREDFTGETAGLGRGAEAIMEDMAGTAALARD